MTMSFTTVDGNFLVTFSIVVHPITCTIFLGGIEYEVYI